MEQPPPLDQLANLRRQAEKMARENNLYRKRSETWIDWPDVQRTRLNVVKAYNSAQPHMKASILKDSVIIHLHSVTPPGEMADPTFPNS